MTQLKPNIVGVFYFVFRKEVFLEVCPENKRDKDTLEKLIVDGVGGRLKRISN